MDLKKDPRPPETPYINLRFSAKMMKNAENFVGSIMMILLFRS